MTEVAYVGFGSNLGDRRAAIEAAVDQLNATPGVHVRALSTIIETDPVGMVEQGRFLNAVGELETTLTPHELMEVCLAVEQGQGRDRSTEIRWGPRCIDLDLLLMGDVVVDDPGRLTLPHPRLHERAFVLEPLVELAPDCLHPVLLRTATELLDNL